MIYCKTCQNYKHNDEFTASELKKTYPICKSCKYIIDKQYRDKNKEKLKISANLYREQNREKINNSKKEYRLNNKDKIKQASKKYYEQNINKIRKYSAVYKKKRKQIDPFFKLNTEVSKSIRKALKKNGATKNNKSFLNYLPYDINQLKQHLEANFEPWMNWNNWGIYKPEDYLKDSSTWKWQIDHITPQSNFPYTSMEDDNFKRCWALTNLRPLRADINHSDGVSRIRHII